MKTKLLLGLLLLFVGFAVGLLTQYSTYRQMERDLSTTRQQLAHYQTNSQLWRLRDAAALLALEAARGNYGTAGECSTRFFNQVRDLASQSTDLTLKSMLQEVLNSRDRITSGIAKQDPAVLSEIQILVTKVHEGVGH